MRTEHEIELRVRYSETDAMGFLHHSRYIMYFEIGRTELFRADGGNYRRMEELGLFFVVVKVEARYRRPARYDDVLTLRTKLTRHTPVRLEHEYRLFRGDELLAEGASVLACVDRSGQLQMIPEDLISFTQSSSAEGTADETP
ncbi:MAG: Acyl-CoA thioester hydrolase YbgC [Planctomycetota bacterium]|jgi:acyl-CoA thioester hydrolase